MAAQEDSTFPVIDAPPEGGDIAGITINRIVAFAGPHVAWLSGVAATWLIVHVHFLGLAHVQQDGVATAIAQALTFVLVSSLVWLGHSKWLTGHHIELRNAGMAAASANSPLNGPTVNNIAPSGDYDANAAKLPDAGTAEDRKDDEELGRGMPLGWDR